MMVNGGNQTAVYVRKETRARRIAFSLPGHSRRVNKNTAGGVLAATVAARHSAKPRVTSVVTS